VLKNAILNSVSDLSNNFETFTNFMESTIFIKASQLYESVEYSQIRWIQADGNHSIIHSLKRKFIVRISLTHLLDTILPDYFIQIHRQIIINLHIVESIDLTTNLVIGKLNNFPIGNTYRSALMANLNLLN